MSYILDALKKSEKERALGNIPTLATSGQDEKKRVPLSWFVTSLVVFAVIAAALGLRSNLQSEEPVAVRPNPAVNAESEASPAAVTTTVQSQGPLAEAPPAMQQEAFERIQSSAIETDIPEALLFADLAPSIRNRLPEMSVNVLSYSKNQGKRFVMINQNIYKQGGNIGGGLVIEDIRETAVVMNFEGVRFLLFP